MILLYLGGGKPSKGEICVPSTYLHLHVGHNVVLFTLDHPNLNQLQTVIFRYLVSHWDEIPFNAMGWLQSKGRIE